MEKLFLAIGVVLLGCTVLAAGLYAWHGHWLPVFLTVGAALVGKMALGFVELLLMPISLPMLYFAKRGKNLMSVVFAVLMSLVGRAAFAAYCAAVLLYLARTPGPPLWLAIALAVAITGSPFALAAKHSEDSDPSNLDLIAAMLGVAVAGALIAFGVSTPLALLPIAILFFLSALVFTAWWVATGMRQARFEYLVTRGAT